MKRTPASPTIGLLAGLAVMLSAVAIYAGYTIVQLHGLRRLQSETIDRNDSLLLLRIQNDLNSVNLAMRDMLDSTEPYPLTAWQSQFARLRTDLDDALAREAQIRPAPGAADQRQYLAARSTEFWDALDRIFVLAQTDEAEARTRIRISLQARQAALSTAVARLLVQNYETEKDAAAEARRIYARGERNVYLFLAAILIVLLATGLYLVQYNRRMFQQVAALSERRSELAQQLIAMQENTFRSISRELHDEFGQILTAIGAMLQRAGRRAPALDESLRTDLKEVQEIVQSTLDKVRTLSQALHPAMLEEVGFEAALRHHLQVFEKQTGLKISYEPSGGTAVLDQATGSHMYRVLQEALNNVARHSQSASATVRLRQTPGCVVLEVEDRGVGFDGPGQTQGIGLVSMRERALLMHGALEFLKAEGGGLLVRLTVPLTPQEMHV
ncbi:MAG TPA: sensor histidine kinase [Candidatus Sulfopaludibacter sp.]|jgi:signal transduction histidine kinase|nr:sensor histidine kinase [Candidatus Sulfopaludibacter sp.]